jgi:hypothetical protein
MAKHLLILLICAVAAFSATVKLYLKDGDYQLVREYQVLDDRVKYLSAERGEWEEIPLELVDLPRTKKEAVEREQTLTAELKAEAEEEAAIRAQRKEVSRVPVEPGVYLVQGEKLQALQLAESAVVRDKKRSILKVISPIPMIPGKSTVELQGGAATLRLTENRPEFYFRLSKDQRLAIARLKPKKDARVVENVTIIPVSNEIYEEPDLVPAFKNQVGELLYKIWPEAPLEAGEYALIEYTEGQLNLQVWDFGVGPGPIKKK